MKRISHAWVVLMPILLILLATYACNKDDNENQGVLNVIVTDAPFPVDLVEEANIVIDQIRIRHASDENGEDEDNFIVLLEESIELNLLELRNGLVYQVVSQQLPVGSYDQIRLRVTDAELVLTNGDVHTVKVPSGGSSGLKINISPAIEVVGGLTSTLILDFDVSKSFVVKGNIDTPADINGFNFKPVIRAANQSTSGVISGQVTEDAEEDNPLQDAAVWLKQDTIITTAFTDTTGYYAFIGIPEGVYTVYATKTNFDTVFYDDVEVVPGNQTVVDFQLTSIE